MIRTIRRIDAALLSCSRPVHYAVIAATLAGMLLLAVSEVPRVYVDFLQSHLAAYDRPEQYGPDTTAGMYASRVILNDPSDMYTRALDQTPLEAEIWSKQALSGGALCDG